MLKSTLTPWDQRLANLFVPPLARTGISPNAVTFTTLIVALAGAFLLALGDPSAANWGAGLFILARFMDHLDGELARTTGRTSRLGYYLDYISGGLSHAALFLCIGIGLRETSFTGLGLEDIRLGTTGVILGGLAAAGAIYSMFLNIKMDQQLELEDGDSVGYPGFAGFELEDGIYLFGPITWAGYLLPFFALSAIGAIAYTLWTLALTLRKKS